ncbi:ArsR/SmtB family transcription factor [Streptomyces phytophilus]|uniref:ArsR/SmtB family transcription factor n=1 Tax=Streptomyces phytophilus TaxID=722715 RepID=UPI0015F0D4C1|nr:metalloregulator ArsR/SmtB family transcription factor [Streptomyces phytophilus]
MPATPTAEDTRGEDRVFGALSSPVRREVLRLLRDEGPQPVQQLAAHFDMRRPSLSEHLKVLREAGLVSEERAGRQRIYRLEAEPLTEVRDWLGPYERFWRAKLAGLAELLDDLPEAAGDGDRTAPADSAHRTSGTGAGT